MNSLYNGPKAKSNTATSSNNTKQQSAEAIDISSDESGDEGNRTESNGKSFAKSIIILMICFF